jgi:transcriptional regulator with XRE-family HTH domain
MNGKFNKKNKDFVKMMKNLSKNLKKSRTKKNLTQQMLASHSNLAISTIWEIENSQAPDVRLSTITAIAKTLEIDPLELFF